MSLPQPIDSQAVPMEGRLGDPATLPRLYAWLARGDWSGMVVVRAGDVERRVYFVEGRVGTAGSTDPGESLSQALIREGLMTEEERSRAAGQLRVTDRGWSFGRQLVRAGMLQEKDLVRVERRRVIQLVESTLGLRTGTYSCEPGTVAGDAQPQQALEIPRLVAEGVLTYWDANSSMEALGGRDAVLDLVVEHLPEHEATGAEEAYDYTLLLCNGKRSVAEVLAASPLPEAASLRFLAALRLIDVVSTRPAAPAAPAPQPEAVVEETHPRVAPPAALRAASATRGEDAPGDATDAPVSPAEMPASLRPAAAASGEAARTDEPAPPAAREEPVATPPPAPARAAPPSRERRAAPAPAEPGSSRAAWLVLIIAVLVAATAFFAWVGWREISSPPPEPEPAAPEASAAAVPPAATAAAPLAPASSSVLPTEAAPPESVSPEPAPASLPQATAPASDAQPAGGTSP